MGPLLGGGGGLGVLPRAQMMGYNFSSHWDMMKIFL
jgi:hypothetical protein